MEITDIFFSLITIHAEMGFPNHEQFSSQITRQCERFMENNFALPRRTK
jgi:hypothetical protein